MPLKNENGAKFHLASPGKELSVNTQAIGRGKSTWVIIAYVSRSESGPNSISISQLKHN
jgi:hypothetical protein